MDAWRQFLNSCSQGCHLRLLIRGWMLPATLSAIVAPTEAVSRDFLLLGGDLACLIDNAHIYADEDLRIYLIPVSQCPDPLPPGGYRLSDLAEAAAPELPQETERLSRFLSLTRQDLDCLARLSVPDASLTYRFDTVTCAVEPMRD